MRFFGNKRGSFILTCQILLKSTFFLLQLIEQASMALIPDNNSTLILNPSMPGRKAKQFIWKIKSDWHFDDLLISVNTFIVFEYEIVTAFDHAYH